MVDMDVFVLDTNFESVAIIDEYESLIWTDRYNDTGDFEIYSSVSDKLLEFAVKGYYLSLLDSQSMMIIEKVKLETDNELGNHITITGRSLESILDRRIVWTQTNISGNLQNGIKKLLDDAFINPAIADRKIENFVFEPSEDPAITSLEYEAQYTGDNLLDVIIDICEVNELGFRIYLNNLNQFVFTLYKGSDRSYDQTDYPYVIFSPNFDNILTSNYEDSDEDYKNVTLVAGEGEGAARRIYVVGEGSGLNRREHFTDARDISSRTDSGGTIPDSQYNENLKTRGEEKLAELKNGEIFEGEVDYNTQFELNKDYFIGDLVQIENEYGIQGVARILEIIRSNDAEGYKISPTFSSVDMNNGG